MVRSAVLATWFRSAVPRYMFKYFIVGLGQGNPYIGDVVDSLYKVESLKYEHSVERSETHHMNI